MKTEGRRQPVGEYEVVIVGGGPTGVMLAAELTLAVAASAQPPTAVSVSP